MKGLITKILLPILLIGFISIAKSNAQTKYSADAIFYTQPDTVSLTENDITKYIRFEIAHIINKIYDSVLSGRIIIFKNKDLTSKISISELSQSPNCISPRYYEANDDTVNSFDSTFCLNYNGLIVNGIQMEGKVEANGTFVTTGDYVQLLQFTSSNPNAAKLENSYYIKLSSWEQVLNQEDKAFINEIEFYGMSIYPFHNGKGLILLINDDLLHEYSYWLLKNFANSWYEGVIHGNIFTYSYPNFDRVAKVAKLKERCEISETVSVQVDPKDSYSTKDSTISAEFDKIDGDFGSVGITVFFRPANRPIGVATNTLSPEKETLFLLRWQDSMAVLNEKQMTLLENVILYKIKDSSW